MAVVTSSNFSLAGGFSFDWATSDGDQFDRLHAAGPAQALENHTHGTGLGAQVVTSGLAALSVTTAKLALLSVTNATIANSTITTAKVASGEHFTPWAYSPPPGPFA